MQKVKDLEEVLAKKQSEVRISIEFVIVCLQLCDQSNRCKLYSVHCSVCDAHSSVV